MTDPAAFPVLVAEPYEIASEDLRSMLRLADELGAEIRLNAASSYYPGRTIRAEFWPLGTGDR